MPGLQLSDKDRATVKQEIEKILISQAKLKRTIFYSEICKK